jgi:8-amino-7-oxononanoate synthase
MSLQERWSATLDELRSQGRYRSFRLPAGIDFTSNDYLGYAHRPIVSNSSLPITGTASRLLRGHHAIWDEVEPMLAQWHGAEAVLMMTSGYAANEGLIATLAEPGDWVAVDELSHACIYDGLRLARPRKFLYRHNDLNHLEEGLKAEAAKRPEGRELFVVTESLFSMDGDTAPLPELIALVARYGAQLIVDEAHSTGCFGPSGSGCVDEAGLRSRVLATIHTGGKALGLPGAYICCSKLLKEYLINRCRHLIFTTALAPAVGSWWKERIPQIVTDDDSREKLRGNAARFRTAIKGDADRFRGSHYIVPIIVGQDEDAVRVATRLQDAGFDIRAIRPPTVPQNTSRLRISIHADHESATLDRLTSAVAEALRS